MTRDDLITQHMKRWGFRQRGPFEGRQQYVDAVIAFLQTRDWAASFEVRLGKPQAEWTPADVQRFHDHLTRPQHQPNPTPVAALFVEAGTSPTTLAALIATAQTGLDELAAQRRRDVRTELPIFANALLIDGRLLVAPCSSGNRLGVLKSAAQQLPLYGFALVFDAFVHVIEPETGIAQKRDALLAQVGTRDARHMLQRRYTVTGRAVRFEAESDMDIRAHMATGQEAVDPYAELFVSVPPVGRPQ